MRGFVWGGYQHVLSPVLRVLAPGDKEFDQVCADSTCLWFPTELSQVTVAKQCFDPDADSRRHEHLLYWGARVESEGHYCPCGLEWQGWRLPDRGPWLAGECFHRRSYQGCAERLAVPVVVVGDDEQGLSGSCHCAHVAPIGGDAREIERDVEREGRCGEVVDCPVPKEAQCVVPMLLDGAGGSSACEQIIECGQEVIVADSRWDSRCIHARCVLWLQRLDPRRWEPQAA